MSDHVEKAVFLKVAAWHGKGIVLEKPENDLAKFLCHAAMDYSVEKMPATFVWNGENLTADNQFHLVRSTDGKVLSPATVTRQYGVIRPLDLVPDLQPFMDEGFATPDAAFTLYNGQSEVISLRLDFQDENSWENHDGSKWVHYLVVQNFHGRGSVRGKVVSIRVVCHNTVTAAFGRQADFAIKHSGTVKDRVSNAIRTMESLRKYLKETGEKLGKLATMPVDIMSTVNNILEIDPAETIPTRTQNRRDAIVSAAHMSPGVSGRTALDVLNGITWYTTHDTSGRGGKDDNDRLESLLNGTRGGLQQKATDYLLALAS